MPQATSPCQSQSASEDSSDASSCSIGMGTSGAGCREWVCGVAIIRAKKLVCYGEFNSCSSGVSQIRMHESNRTGGAEKCQLRKGRLSPI
jgi:hypothetical protein